MSATYGDHEGKPKEDKPFDPKAGNADGKDTADGVPPPGKHAKPKPKKDEDKK
ncbi:hypothetical protein [Spongiactinospora rosea]|uniref:hypothetical protein n=1 Tax=Spongiactinospora rosea TaxID=2248750 RepID=UPI001314DE92|nr:hypothetical protein [Spongiactinospora rosea]